MASIPLVRRPTWTLRTADDAKRFCAPYYVPNNAVISLSGDLSSDNARMLIEKYFAGIPRGPAPPRRPIAPSGLAAVTRLVLEDRAGGDADASIRVASVEFAHADRLPLVALGSLLSRDRVGRLNKLLVYDRRLASRVVATNFDFEKSGLFQIDVTPQAGASLTSSSSSSTARWRRSTRSRSRRRISMRSNGRTPFSRSRSCKRALRARTRSRMGNYSRMIRLRTRSR